MKFKRDQYEPNAKKIIKIGSQLGKKSGNIQKKYSFEMITFSFFEVG